MLVQVDGFIIKWFNCLKKVRLIILDDFGLQFIFYKVKLLLFQILEDCYEYSVILICLQLFVAKWYEYFDEFIIVDVIFDRFVYRVYWVELWGESLRKIINNLFL